MRQLAALKDEREQLSRNTGELLRLRGEVGVLRRQLGESKLVNSTYTNTVTNAIEALAVSMQLKRGPTFGNDWFYNDKNSIYGFQPGSPNGGQLH